MKKYVLIGITAWALSSFAQAVVWNTWAEQGYGGMHLNLNQNNDYLDISCPLYEKGDPTFSVSLSGVQDISAVIADGQSLGIPFAHKKRLARDWEALRKAKTLRLIRTDGKAYEITVTGGWQDFPRYQSRDSPCGSSAD